MVNVFGLFWIMSNKDKKYNDAALKAAEELGKAVFKRQFEETLQALDKAFAPPVVADNPQDGVQSAPKKKRRRYYRPRKGQKQ